ncbi:SDR family oxidoreductase [Microtetraspora sp. AC03309]|uniref:SDR family oxidoreductase n=1 Tax=Microtetraspora sp. AC03309 TaxID=2779376 RepID=UPI001E4A1C9D|nr:SDR family oxidoreductase [Microtetraspora sp. AC03309]MCC5581128.1 SDR family oxidoreductase [Microtetraspora sp. AC03309]
MTRYVAVVIGVGGMGLAIARRIGPGTHLLLADFNQDLLASVTQRLRAEGYEVTPAEVDVSSRESVAALAAQAASLGEVRSVVHTAGLSPVQAPVPAILAVDLLGVALVLEEFGQVVAPGGAGVVIASMAGHGYPAPAREDALQLATAPADDLLSLPITAQANFPDSGTAYSFAKRANLLRVQAASQSWGARGARVNSISPGIIATPMGQSELNGEHGAVMRMMIDASNAKRVGTPADIAAAADFLLSPAASFISGTDLLVDGGVVGAVNNGARD